LPNQSINLTVSGLYTNLNDYNGLPQGALKVARNVESKSKNLLQSRNGFELAYPLIEDETIIKMTDFYIDSVLSAVVLTDAGNVYYFDESAVPDPDWVLIPGISADVFAPDIINAKSRFYNISQNLYLTSLDGIRSLSSGSGSQMIRAGVPKGLNISAETNGDQLGFFSNNTVNSTTGNITASSPLVSNILDSSGIEVGQFISGVDVDAKATIQDLTYSAELFGTAGNAITVEYTGGGTAGSEVVTVLGNAVSVQIQSGVSTADQIRTAILGSAAALTLVSVVVSGTGSNAQTTVAPTSLTGGLENVIPVGTKVSSISPEATIIVQDGKTAAGSATVTDLASNTGIVAGVKVSGSGIPSGATVLSTSGSGPYSVVLSVAAFQTNSSGTGVPITFTRPLEVTMDQNAVSSLNDTPITFYKGAQVGYRIIFGRVEVGQDGTKITRVGAPTSIGIVNNVTPYSTNVDVTTTLPKNAENEITFLQLFRSEQTAGIDITPLDQYNLVLERQLTPTDFTNRVITLTDLTPDSLKGIPLYAGSDREGILQSNDPPPSCYDIANFKNFNLYANTLQPSTLKVTIVAVGGTDGIQLDDEITISGMLNGVPYSETYTAKSVEDATNREFALVTSGTPSQNITDTAQSLIRVVNYDEDLPIHTIYLSSTLDLPGQIQFEADAPSKEVFIVTANLHQSAYDPELDDVDSNINNIPNGILVSKLSELEAVPASNLLRAGDSSHPILRVIPLRDYVVILKTDGIYKILGSTPNSLVVQPFDSTTKIIGADTAVALNSAVYAFSNQGVVNISDGGVDVKSIPIDDQLNTLTGSFLDNIKANAFGIGYESERKYILSLPTTDPDTVIQYVYNYITNSWTTWDRELYTAYVASYDKLVISSPLGISEERKTQSFRDYVDEAINVDIIGVQDTYIVELDSVEGVRAGDILFQDSKVLSPITEVSVDGSNTVIVQYPMSWDAGPAEVLRAIDTEVTWIQQFGQNPALTKQFSEGQVLFKKSRFTEGLLNFQTDFSSSNDFVPLIGPGTGGWGLFPWGSIPWGGTNFPQNIRFYIPQNKQFGSYVIPTVRIRQGYSDYQIQGLSIAYNNVSVEVGK
jgi:hypothetical protein